MSLKKLSILLLVVLLLLPFAACNQDNTNSGTVSLTDSTVSTESTTSEKVLFEGLPTDTYDGREVNILVGGLQQGDRYQSREIFGDETINELINDAVLARNSIVEEKFDIKITGYATGAGESITTMIRALNQSQDATYDILAPFMNDAAVMASEGFFYNLKEIDNMRLDGAYWDQRANEDLEIMNKLYFTTGYISILDNECTQCMIFNKDVVENYSVPNLYDLVLNGEWTIDKMLQITRDVTADTDGEAGMTYKDMWGLYINSGEPTHMFIAAGQRFVDKDGNGNPIITIDTPQAQAVIAKLAEVMGDRQSSIIIEDLQSTALGEGFEDCYYLASEQLAAGKTLLRTMCLVDLRDLADKYFEYGILPLPKYDMNQDNYYSNVSTFPVPGYCIPIQAADKDFSALVLSALCEASEDTLNTAYYDQMLKNRRFVDNESKEMLDIIFENRVYDLGVVFNWSGIRDVISTSVTNGQNTFASTWEAAEASVTNAMNTTIDAFSSLND
ncbi:MAG: hypothetical protein A2Y17_12885 [Clostridiales bacterium GWF2_38_85]|nr:MAG: hypothetical protein A2Y17_12885 [Clostridiales bacterium GWF2_38_85]HBL84154.1 hypothetical protein [Clostridiales bacterium]